MLAGELKLLLEKVPDNMDVFIKQVNTEFSISLTETAAVVNASFSEEEGGPVLAKDKVFLITDEIY